MIENRKDKIDHTRSPIACIVPLPTTVNQKIRRSRPVTVRPLNADVRPREYLTPAEVERMQTAAAQEGRHGHRDATLILLAYRHGLRASELVALRWDIVDLKAGTLHVARLKNGDASVHPLRGPELRALRRLQRESAAPSPYLFVTERGGPLTTDTLRKIVQRAGERARLGFPAHPHMLRHACGFYLANKGQDTRAIQHYLGHKNIQHTVLYTKLTDRAFRDFWRD
jgi:type 1 fimbriae regulatory protein FimE